MANVLLFLNKQKYLELIYTCFKAVRIYIASLSPVPSLMLTS